MPDFDMNFEPVHKAKDLFLPPPLPALQVRRVELGATQADPLGRDPHQPGAKLDAGKAQFDYVLGYFPKALAAVNEVAEFGAKKYTPGGWVTVPDGIKRYGNANIRHHVSRLSGEATDPESKLLHAAHAAWCALAVLELALKELDK